jgi:TRAP-type mannitol/chloroaromatic compound transport system permease small subunit
VALHARLADAADAIVRGVGHVAAWTALALVLLVAWNVLGRYLLGVSSVGAQELEWHLLAVGALFGMSYGLNQGGEVRVDVLYDRYSARGQAAVDLLTGLLLLAICIAVFWLSIGYVQQSWRIGESSPDPGGLTDRWILKAAIPVTFGLLALQALVMLLRAAARLSAPR